MNRKGIVNKIKAVIHFFMGNIIAFVLYDRKYLNSKYFKNSYGGIGAIGWEWVITDFMGRLLLNINRGIPFPVSPRVSITNFKNIIFDYDDINNFQTNGSYFQALGEGKIYIGKSTWIAPNVGIITTNHDIYNPDDHVVGKDVKIGERCWIGMNSIILPGVELGKNTVVGAGAVVTKSFKEGNCVIAGNPARVIKYLNS